MRSDQSKPSAGTDAWCSATGPVFGTLAAATAADSAYGLDAVGFEDALGIAATQSGGLMAAQFESMVKRMQHGFAARNGLTAAALAAGLLQSGSGRPHALFVRKVPVVSRAPAFISGGAC